LLVLESSSFLLSGWSPAKFADPAQTIELLRLGGGMLRAAAVFGFAGLIVTTYLIAGLAAELAPAAPGRASGVLYLGLIGIAGHSLVPLGLWLGVPAFVGLAARDLATARSGWAAFGRVSDTAHGVGSLFMGAATVLAGSALVGRASQSRILGWIAVGAGLLTLASLLSVGTPAAALGGVLFLPALVFTVVFRLWAGAMLWRLATRPAVA
jgi:hypothetical protein